MGMLQRWRLAITSQPRFYVKVLGGFFALILLLNYNLFHTGALLARYSMEPWVGYGAALAVEVTVVVMSLQIGERREKTLDTVFFYAVLATLVGVSFVANVVEGHYIRYGEQLTVANVSDIDPIQAVVGLLATGLISLITFALAEVIGQYQPTAQEQKEEEEAPQFESGMTKLQRAQTVLVMEPGITVEELALKASVSTSTARRALNGKSRR